MECHKGGKMKEKIISFLLISIIISLCTVIGILAFSVYVEMSEIGTIQINFEGEYPTIEYTPTNKETIDETIYNEMFSGIDDGNTSNENTETIQYRHLYNQLNSTAKVIYDKLYKNRENLKTGTYTVEFGNEFQELLSTENGEVELKKYYQSAIEVLIYENPEIFYLDATNMYLNIEKITRVKSVKYNVYVNNGNKPHYLIEGLNSKQDVDQYAIQIEQVKNYIISKIEGKTDYEKIKTVHDYLIETIDYDSTISEDNIYDIYGALVKRKCVCEGYAKAFQYIMNQIGIENTIVIGTGTNSKSQTENHAWNYVKLNGNWYAIDVTWDDPIITGGGKLTSKSKYEYFLKGSKKMSENHVPSGKFTTAGQEFTYPVLSAEDYR